MMHYRAFSVLWQMACDIELLHKVQNNGVSLSKCITTKTVGGGKSMLHWHHTTKTSKDSHGKSLLVDNSLMSVYAGALGVICVFKAE